MPLTGEYEPSSASWSRDQVQAYERSGGAAGNELNGKPVIILTSVGAKSGKLRKTPLMRVEHDGEYAVVASLGGAPKHPVWYYNLTANPHVELQDGPAKDDYTAREAQGAEREAWWERAVAAWPDYAEYQKKTTRVIPVFVLTPAGALPVAEAVEETAEHAAFAHERGSRRGSDRELPGDRPVVVGPGDGINDLGLVKVLRALDLRHVSNKHAILHDLCLETGRPVGVPLGLAPAGQRHPHAVLTVASEQVSIDTAVTEGVDHPTRPELIHTNNVTLVPERSLNASSIPPLPRP